MGVVNLTPDSFSDGGRFEGAAGVAVDIDAAVEAALAALAAGADLIDVGGESTRPGASPVSADDEAARVVPVIRALRGRTTAPISVDTLKASVAALAIDAGADLVNDVSGGTADPDMAALIAARPVGWVVGHLVGATPAEAHAGPEPDFEAIVRGLADRLAAVPSARARSIVDPGLGFGKGTARNLELCARAGELGARLGRPVLVGPSRKRFLGELLGGRAVDGRDAATIGACLAAVAGGAHVVRVHAAGPVADALRVFVAAGGAGGPR